jgi:para-nitrobenzyl esterase
MVLPDSTMKFTSFLRATPILLVLFATACSESSGESAQLPEPTEPLELTASAAPFDLGSIDAEFYEGIVYGPHDENLFDIYIPTSEEPTPLLLYIHGGGFTGGSRDTSGHEDRVLTYLSEGVAYASIDYRLLQSPDPDGVLKPLSDSTRALQFIRYHASQLNIDRDKIILMGGSAGAGTSLWIAFNDEMANPDSEDPVEQHSTRVSAAIAIATQATYDIGKWKTVVFEEYNLDLLELADALGLSQNLLDFYGITEIEDFESSPILEYRARVDMLDLMDAEDPPFYAQNDLEPAGPSAPPLSVNLAFHHANHALVLQEKADAIGLENVVYMKGLMVEDPSGEDDVDFALRHFGL